MDGVTRDSICKIGSEILNLPVEETDIFLEDLFEAEEVFCTGTAVEVTPVGKVSYKNRCYIFNKNKMGPITNKLKKTLIELQRDEIKSPFNWTYPITN